MSEKNITDHLTTAIAVILVGGLCLGWVGSRAVDYTFSEVRENSVFRVRQIEENKQIHKDIEENTAAIRDIAIMKEMLIRVDERTAKWEPTE